MKGRNEEHDVRVHREHHARTKCWLLRWSERAANSRQARRSSRSKSGNSKRRSSMLSPAARCSSIDSTGYRRPRMTGYPRHISEVIVMRKRNWLMCQFCFRRSEPSQAQILHSGLRASPRRRSRTLLGTSASAMPWTLRLRFGALAAWPGAMSLPTFDLPEPGFAPDRFAHNCRRWTPFAPTRRHRQICMDLDIV